jgi:DNA transformation protein
VSDEFTAYALEQLEAVGPVKAARFFSGTGLSRNGTQFAFVIGGSLYFVVDDETRQRYEAAGMQCFEYDTKKRRVQVRRYYEVPEEVLSDPESLREWANESLAVAARTAKPRPRRTQAKRRKR